MRFLLRLGWIPVALLALWLTTAPAHAAAPDAVSLYRLYFTDWTDLSALAGQLDIWAVDHTRGFLVAPLTAAQIETLAASHRLEVTTTPDWTVVQAALAAGGIPDFACYRTVAETNTQITRLAKRYPNLARVVDIGDTWDKTTPGGPAGYDLRVLVITNRATGSHKPRFFLMGGIHARELVTSETALRFAEWLLAGYGADPDATWLLDHGELHALVAANPDGRIFAEQLYYWRKNTNIGDMCPYNLPPALSYGVDLNRNFAYGWNSCLNCSSGYSCDQTYRGARAASEPETQAIQDYLRTLFPDRRAGADAAPDDTPGLLVSLHSYGLLVLYPWGMSTDPAPNEPGLAALGERFAGILNYQACQSGGIGCLYPTDGTTDDWSYGELGIASFTFEMGTAFFQQCETYEEAILDSALAALEYAFRVAVMPYRQPQGPHIAHMAATPATVAAGDSFSMSLRLDEPAASVRVSFGEPPWLPGAQPVVYPAPPPGSTGAITLSITHATGGLPQGPTLLFAQAQNSQTVFGPVAAEFITITRASPFRVSVVPAGQATYPGDAAQFTVAVTNTGTVTATYVFSATADWPATLTPTTPTVLGPREVTSVTLTVTPPRGTAGAVTPAIVYACMVGPAPDCIRAVTVLSVRERRTILPVIALQGTLGGQ
jgi:hypothetical protein